MIARKSLLIVSSNFVLRFTGWIGLIILAKLWGGFAPEALGVIGFAMSFIAIFNIFSGSGFDSAHIKRVSEGMDLGLCIGTFATIKMLLTGVMTAVIFFYLYISKNIFNIGFSDATTESVVIIFILYFIFKDLRQISESTFAGRKEIAKKEMLVLFEVVKIPLMIFVAIAGVNMASINPAIHWPSFLEPLRAFIASHAMGSLAVAYLFSMIIPFIVGLFLIRHYPIKKPNWKTINSYFYFAIPVLIISAISVISLNIDKLMIGYFWDAKRVGYYFTVQQIYVIVTILASSIGAVLFPTISEYHSKNKLIEVNKIIHLAERYISMIIIPPIVLIIVFANPVIEIMLTKSYLPAASVMIILLIYAFIYSLKMPYTAMISGMNKPLLGAKIGAVICIVNISLNYLFIPQHGVLSIFGINGPAGAAVATVISSLVGFIGYLLAAKKLTGLKIFQNHTPRHIIAGVVMGGVLYFIAFRTAFFPEISWYHLLIFAGLGLGVYLAILYMLKEFSKNDYKFFVDLFNPLKMLKYIKFEIKDKPKK
jgi:O-antigen/teichoic acid export membrane protein